MLELFNYSYLFTLVIPKTQMRETLYVNTIKIKVNNI